jgi:hypothetical protein
MQGDYLQTRGQHHIRRLEKCRGINFKTFLGENVPQVDDSHDLDKDASPHYEI